MRSVVGVTPSGSTCAPSNAFTKLLLPALNSPTTTSRKVSSRVHNAVDKIAGWMLSEAVKPDDKILYTTGRLTSEMVIKTAAMGIPVLASRSGFTAWGVELAQQVGLTLIGRLRGKRFICLSGAERLIWDADPEQVPEEPHAAKRKGGRS